MESNNTRKSVWIGIIISYILGFFYAHSIGFFVLTSNLNIDSSGNESIISIMFLLILICTRLIVNTFLKVLFM